MNAETFFDNACDSRDLELIQMVLGGNVGSFEMLVAPHEPVLRTIIRRYLQCEEDIRDVVQSTWMQVWRNLSRFRGQSRFRSWIIRIAINEALQVCRHRGRRNTTSIDQPVLSQEVHKRASVAPPFLEPFLLRAVRELPAPYGRTLSFHALEGLTDSEIASLEKITLSAAKSRLHRAKAMLRRNWNVEVAA
jgi:RNA polymerase sigma-70 factor, ECF subfamily